MAINRGRSLVEAVPALGNLGSKADGFYKLLSTAPGNGGASFALPEGTTTLGRDEVSDIVIRSPQASRAHCELAVTSEGHVWVRDSGSANGTFVNRTRIDGPTKMEVGDELWVAPEAVFQLIVDEALVAPENVQLTVNPGTWERSLSQAGPLGAVPSNPKPARGSETLAPSLGVSALADQTLAVQGNAYEASSVEVVEEEARFPREPAVAERIAELEAQRKALAILYQVTLRCLELRSLEETEELLTNVLNRLARFDWGFIAYQSATGPKATIAAGAPQRPTPEALAQISQYATRMLEPAVITDPARLKSLAVEHAALMLIPIFHGGETMVGVIACAGRTFDDETLDIVLQLSNVCAAALVGRWH